MPMAQTEMLSDDQLIACGLALAVHARKRPEKVALISPSGDRTWRSLNERANQLARIFRAGGLVPGDSVALLAHNGPEFAEVWAATQRAGLRLTAVNWHQSAETVAYIVDNCDARALVASARFGEAARQAAATSGRLEICLAFAGRIEGFDDYEHTLEGVDRANIDAPEPGSTMLYTSGTTGRPKGVFRRTRPVVSQLTGVCNETAKWDPESDVALVTGPLYHAAPLGINFVIPMNAGVSVLMMDKWDAEETLRLIDAHKVTHTHVVPTMMHRMLQLPETVRRSYDVSSMRWMIHGAAPCPMHVKQAMMDWFGPVLFEYYSATEGGGVFVRPDDWSRKPGTVGRAVPGVEVKLLGMDGEPTPLGRE